MNINLYSMVQYFESFSFSLSTVDRFYLLLVLLRPLSAQHSLRDILPFPSDLSRHFVLWHLPAGISTTLRCRAGRSGRVDWFLGFIDFAAWKPVSQAGYRVDPDTGRLLLSWADGWRWKEHRFFVCRRGANEIQYHAINILWPPSRQITRRSLLVTMTSREMGTDRKYEDLLHCSR